MFSTDYRFDAPHPPPEAGPSSQCELSGAVGDYRCRVTLRPDNLRLEIFGKRAKETTIVCTKGLRLETRDSLRVKAAAAARRSEHIRAELYHLSGITDSECSVAEAVSEAEEPETDTDTNSWDDEAPASEISSSPIRRLYPFKTLPPSRAPPSRAAPSRAPPSRAAPSRKQDDPETDAPLPPLSKPTTLSPTIRDPSFRLILFSFICSAAAGLLLPPSEMEAQLFTSLREVMTQTIASIYLVYWPQLTREVGRGGKPLPIRSLINGGRAAFQLLLISLKIAIMLVLTIVARILPVNIAVYLAFIRIVIWFVGRLTVLTKFIWRKVRRSPPAYTPIDPAKAVTA